jgi:DNA-binding transcriptional LysR family regulator
MTAVAEQPRENRRRTRSDRTTSLGDIEIFAEVVDAGSMTAAARRLGLAVTVVSKRVQRLEAKLGARLLERSTRRIVLTEAGQGFHDRIGRVLEAFEDAIDFASESSTSLRGTLRVLAPASFGRWHLAPHLPRFLEAHPALELDLELSDVDLDIVAGGFHLALRIGELADSSLIAKKLAPERDVLCASPSYVARFGMPEAVEDLARHALLAPEFESSWVLTGPAGEAEVAVRTRLRTASCEAIREAVISGAGIGLRPAWHIDRELAEGRLQVLLPDYRRVGCAGIFAVYPSRELMPRKARSFLEFLAGTYGPRPYWERYLPPGRTPDRTTVDESAAMPCVDGSRS